MQLGVLVLLRGHIGRAAGLFLVLASGVLVLALEVAAQIGLAARALRRGEANLRGHLKGEDEEANGSKDEEESGSSAYVAPEKDKDTQLQYALDLLRGIKSVDTDAKKKAEAN